MSAFECSPETTEDSLLKGRVKLLQPRTGYRAAIDPVFLAAAVPAKTEQAALEFGTGGGAAALCLLARIPLMREIIGLELDIDQAELAKRNATLNGWDGRFKVVLGDAADPPATIPRNYFDHVFMNPPYLEEGLHAPPPNSAKARAHVEGTGFRLERWLAQAAKHLKPKGTLTLIHRADRLDDILRGMPQHLGSLRLLPLWPKRGEAASRVIVQAIKGGRGPCRLLPGLVLHDGTGYTEEADAILAAAAPLDLAR